MRRHQRLYKISDMCQILNVSRSSYYQWLKGLPSFRAKENEMLSDLIYKLFLESHRTYGTRSIKRDLHALGYVVSRRRIGRLMARAGLVCKTTKKFKVTTNSKHNLPISPNLLQRNFQVDKPDYCYVGDITYIWTQEGWLYLATVIDLFSRKVVGWAIDKRMKSDLVNKALLKALWIRKPNARLIWHTDRGSQYCSKSHRRIIQQHQIKQSMSRKGDCWDNAVAESFFRTLKTECTYHENFKTREQAKKAIFEYIEVFYNRKRRHTHNDYLSPVEFERKSKFA
ncbi:IS3 family transposase [Fangia hongkongensis]|uniref:IS3 family transposase n=5 Tax=Fangia hongkongensis TaxID=270495 RepID=UPI002D806B27|nr:IS3 family transposase [Fangia hongkongensis]